MVQERSNAVSLRKTKISAVHRMVGIPVDIDRLEVEGVDPPSVFDLEAFCFFPGLQHPAIFGNRTFQTKEMSASNSVRACSFT